jgi:hypothetical protein
MKCYLCVVYEEINALQLITAEVQHTEFPQTLNAIDANKPVMAEVQSLQLLVVD